MGAHKRGGGKAEGGGAGAGLPLGSSAKSEPKFLKMEDRGNACVSLLPSMQWEYLYMVIFKMCMKIPGSEACKARS